MLSRSSTIYLIKLGSLGDYFAKQRVIYWNKPRLKGRTDMPEVFKLAKGIVKRSLERDRSSERYVEALSRSLWPWRESWLLALVCLLAVLDYVSTYAVLELSGNEYVYEGGPLASWALQIGGFTWLFLVDMAAAIALLLVAITIRSLHSKFGFQGFGRTAFVFVLTPYVVITMAAVYNNIVLTFL